MKQVTKTGNNYRSGRRNRKSWYNEEVAMFQKRLKVTDRSTHHFFVVDALLMVPIVTDPDGTILVYTDRAKAQAEGHKRARGGVIATIGMGDEKWEAFQ